MDGGPETDPDNNGRIKMAEAKLMSESRQSFLVWPKQTGSVAKPAVFCFAKRCNAKSGMYFSVVFL